MGRKLWAFLDEGIDDALKRILKGISFTCAKLPTVALKSEFNPKVDPKIEADLQCVKSGIHSKAASRGNKARFCLHLGQEMADRNISRWTLL